jgi:L-ascorbate metabolism protein UlaG (beta-lactamase superfamily)
VSPATLTYVGHATVMLDLDGGSLLTDPMLRGRLWHLRRVAGAAARLPTPPTAVLLSHVHHDHLDGRSLRRIDRDVPVLAPRGAGRLLRRLGRRVVVELLPGETVRLGAIEVVATAAAHDVRRIPGAARVPALGYVVDGGVRAYFAGDTDLFDGMSEIGDMGLDVALIPVAGWGPRLPPGHLDPERAAEAVRRLRPRLAVPIHWGTLATAWAAPLTAAARREPAERFRRAVASTAPGVAVSILAPGERRSFG